MRGRRVFCQNRLATTVTPRVGKKIQSGSGSIELGRCDWSGLASGGCRYWSRAAPGFADVRIPKVPLGTNARWKAYSTIRIGVIAHAAMTNASPATIAFLSIQRSASAVSGLVPLDDIFEFNLVPRRAPVRRSTSRNASISRGPWSDGKRRDSGRRISPRLYLRP